MVRDQIYDCILELLVRAVRFMTHPNALNQDQKPLVPDHFRGVGLRRLHVRIAAFNAGHQQTQRFAFFLDDLRADEIAESLILRLAQP